MNDTITNRCDDSDSYSSYNGIYHWPSTFGSDITTDIDDRTMTTTFVVVGPRYVVCSPFHVII
jgi:hypothetical protein